MASVPIHVFPCTFSICDVYGVQPERLAVPCITKMAPMWGKGWEGGDNLIAINLEMRSKYFDEMYIEMIVCSVLTNELSVSSPRHASLKDINRRF